MSDSTCDRILEVAQEMAQKGGFHDFSFRSIAAEVGVKSASVHYHFPTKGDLGAAVVKRYRARFGDQLAAISSRTPNARDRLGEFVALFRRSLVGGRLCLCGVLGAEIGGLPPETAEEIGRFFRDCQDWLTGVLAAGKEAGALTLAAAPPVVAFSLLGLLEGAMLVVRNRGDIEQFDQAVTAYLEALRG